MPKSTNQVPASATMFFCIGAQKAGTTWLYNALRANPHVHFCRNKELHYFDVIAGKAELTLANRINIAQVLAGRLQNTTGKKNSVTLKQLRDVTNLLTIYTGGKGNHKPYLNYLLRGYRDQPIVCDITPSYAILNRNEFVDMTALGSTRFGFIMRDPIDRMWSQIRMAVKFDGTVTGDFEEACVARAQTLIDSGRLPRIERADYRRTIEELESVVPRENIKYLFYENLFAPETMVDLCAFLGIDPVSADGDTRSNPGRGAMLPVAIRSAFEDAFAPQYEYVRKRFGDAVPDTWANVVAT